LVSNLDFAETLLDAAGVAAPMEMQGRSFRPLLGGSSVADWRKSFYYQYYEYPEPHRVQPHYGVVTERYKLVRFFGAGSDYTELFDLATDPNEMRDVSTDSAYAPVLKDLTGELARLRRDLRAPETVTPEMMRGGRLKNAAKQ
jgi:arylsulfatase A-like enzyme